jgi:aldehyde dehydrogenase (NAD+)
MSDLVLPRTQLLIGGDWADAAGRKQFETLNPATEAVITEVAQGGAADVDAAVGAARRALETGPWPRMSGAQRGRVMNRLAAIMREREDELVLLESVDAGKPLAATRRQDIAASIDCLEHYAGWADKLADEVIPVRSDALTYTKRVPVGVVGAIVPWNFPLMNAVWKLAPALACGCTVVLKPAELTPLSALWLGAAALDAGLPPGVLNIVTGLGHEAGAALAAHPGIDKIAFTGSPGVGRTIMRAAAENVTRVGLELGGKAPSVIFADADLDLAVKQTASGGLFNAGQVCSAATRIVVEDSVHDEFVERLVARAKSYRLGDP